MHVHTGPMGGWPAPRPASTPHRRAVPRGAERLRRASPAAGLALLLAAVAVTFPGPAMAASARPGSEVAAAFLEIVTSGSFTADASISGEIQSSLSATIRGSLRVAPGAFLVDATAAFPDGTALPVRRLTRTGDGSWFTFPLESYAWAPDPMTWGPTAPSFGSAFAGVSDAHEGSPVEVDGRALVPIELPGLDVHALGRSLGLADPDPGQQPVSAVAAFLATPEGQPARLRLVQDFATPAGDVTYEYVLTFLDVGESPGVEAPEVARTRFASNPGRYSIELPLGWFATGDTSDPVVAFRSINGPQMTIFPTKLRIRGRMDTTAELLNAITTEREREFMQVLPLGEPLTWQHLRIGGRDARLAVAPYAKEGVAQLLMLATTVRDDMGYTVVWFGAGWGVDSQEAFIRHMLEGFRPGRARKR